MLGVLDPHSSYFDPVDYASFKTEQRSEYFGIGATIEDLREGKDVNTLFARRSTDSPAARARLRFGDRIVAVDGQSMKGKTYPEVRKFLLGPRGTTVKGHCPSSRQQSNGNGEYRSRCSVASFDCAGLHASAWRRLCCDDRRI